MTTLKSTLIAIGLIASLSCTSEIATSDPQTYEGKTQTTINIDTDESGNEVRIVKSKRNEGFTIYPSNQITTIKHEFHCEGYKVEVFIVERKENQDMRSIDLTIKSNGEEIDLKPIIGTQANLFGHSNLTTDFSCVDDIARVTVNGQRNIENSETEPRANILDFLIDRKTGYITSR